MKIWLDTIDIDVICEARKTGIIDGITTNPTILTKAKNVKETLQRLLEIQPGPVAVQVIADDVENIVEEAITLSQFSNRIIIKILINRNGLIAIEQLKKFQLPVMGTGILFPIQAFLAAHHQVSYIAPYFSHLGAKPYETLKTITDIVSHTNTKILVASLRDLDQILYCATLGIDSITIKPNLFHDLVSDQSAVETLSKKFFSEWTANHAKTMNEICK